MSHPVDDQQPDRPTRDRFDVSRVYEQLDIDSVEQLESLLASHLRRRDAGSFESSSEYRRYLVRSFEDAFIDESGRPILPEAVDVALVDASHWVVGESTPTDGTTDTDVASRLVTAVGQVVPAYAERGLSTTGAIYPAE